MIFVQWHLGLGDAICCADIIAEIAKTNDMVIVPAYEHNMMSVRSFFLNLKNVLVVKVNSDKDYSFYSNKKNYKLGFYNKELPKLDGEYFVDWFYRQAGLKKEFNQIASMVNHSVIKANSLITFKQDFVFVHDDVKRGFEIDLNNVPKEILIRPYMLESVLFWHNILFASKEIHCINSSFIHLVEALPTKGKLVFHNYVRPLENHCFTKNWEVLN